MENDQTPIEGKGEEMVPNRGLPFDEVNRDWELGIETSIENETEAELTMGEAGNGGEEIPVQADDSDEWLSAAEALEEDMAEFSGGFQPAAPETGEEMFMDASDEAAPPSEEFILEDSFPSEEVAMETAASESLENQETYPVGFETKPSDSIEDKRIFRDTTLELPGPGSGNDEWKAPEAVAGLKATKKMLDLLVPNKRVEQLWDRADQLQTQVFDEINELNLARALLEQIRSAKNLLLADKENFEEAERSINEVEYRIVYGKRFKQWGALGYLLLGYEVIWGAVTVYLMYILLFRVGIDGLNLNVQGLLTSNEVFIGIFAALFGALGGVAGALFALWRYITEQRFNPQFSIWYVTQPIIGLTIGSVVYIILKIGLNITAGSINAEVGSLFLPSLLAYLAGFQQNVFLDLAKQILKRFKSGNSDAEESSEGENSSGNAAG